jgi:hypothetical protein
MEAEKVEAEKVTSINPVVVAIVATQQPSVGQ